MPLAAILASALFIDALPRRHMMGLSSIVSGLSLIMLSVVSSSEMYMLYVSFGMFSVFMKLFRSVVFTYTPEVYSTGARSSALGIMTSADRLAGIFMPIISTLFVYTSFRLTCFVFGACFIGCFIFGLLLRIETKGKGLAESTFMASLSRMHDDEDDDLGIPRSSTNAGSMYSS